MSHPLSSSSAQGSPAVLTGMPSGAKARSFRGTLPAAIHAEWIKLWSLRSTWILLAFNLLAGTIMSWAVGMFSGEEASSVGTAWFYWTVISAVMAAAVGVLVFTADLQHGVLAGMLTAQSVRWVILAAKVVGVGAFGLVLGVTAVIAGIGGASMSGIPIGSAGAIATGVLWALGYTVLAALLGLGVGVLVRSSAIAIAGVLIWGFMIEMLLTLFLPVEIARFLPFLAGDRMLAVPSPGLNAEAVAVELSRFEGALVLGTYVALLMLAGTLVFNRRDVA
jgi:hypothetical protein